MKFPTCVDEAFAEAVQGLLICSERIAQEEEFNGGHMTLEDGLEVFHRAYPTWFQRLQKPMENDLLEWE